MVLPSFSKCSIFDGRHVKAAATSMIAAVLVVICARVAGADTGDPLTADDPDYWNQVYRLQSEHGRRSYEWYGLGYNELRDSFLEFLSVEDSIGREKLLVVGSGDSDLSSSLAAEKLETQSGVRHTWQVTSIDFSEEVTRQMRQRHPSLDFQTMDARNLSKFQDGHFDAVLDKGLSDCLGSSAEKQQYFQELHRVLKESGRLVVVSMKRLTVDHSKDGPDSDTIVESTDTGDLGRGWKCRRKEFFGPLFTEDSPTRPPFAMPGTEGTIPYHFLACKSLSQPFAKEERPES
eukprot:TRINITY_DN1275_c1_g4_i1.p1 TRINITY_DN1275_c1_g4~~TRINITY_DN1275_c1_g4_i1.p1  ORF type:complete len:309 (+),score=52.96 TRINITY_DN1275_c1_g4_i1:60-929(+)